jgi:hypothetical protein
LHTNRTLVQHGATENRLTRSGANRHGRYEVLSSLEGGLTALQADGRLVPLLPANSKVLHRPAAPNAVSFKRPIETLSEPD